MTRNIAIAFIGYGEVGQLFARQLRDEAGIAVSAYDLKLADATARQPLVAAAAESGVRLAPSAREAAAGAALVFSAVTASAAEEVAHEAAHWLADGQVLVDLNSAAPETKRRCAAALGARQDAYVEAAVMAPVAQPGIRVPILTGGPKAVDVTERLNGLGFRARAVSDGIGRASATKLCRSLVIKGLEALMIDCARASAHWGVADDVFRLARPDVSLRRLRPTGAGHGPARRTARHPPCGGDARGGRHARRHGTAGGPGAGHRRQPRAQGAGRTSRLTRADRPVI